MEQTTSPQTEQQIDYRRATTDTPLVEVTKVIHASPAAVFRALSEEKLIREWWGPFEMMCPFAELNFTEGGKFLFAMEDIADQEKIIWSTGTFQQIIPERKIVFTNLPSNAEGKLVTESDYEGPFSDNDTAGIVTYELFATGGETTRLELTHAGLPARMHDECVEGWSSSLDKLREVVEKQ